MKLFIKKINAISKDTFTFADLRKIANMDDASLRVAIHRLRIQGVLTCIVKGVYTREIAHVDWERFAQELYSPSYLSFEWALNRSRILSQQPYALTLATTQRTRHIETSWKTVIYHHIQPSLYWGYKREGDVYIAEPEKAFLDLAYLSLNGYARFDPEEMNIQLLDRKKLKSYVRKFKKKKLEQRMAQFL